MALTAPLPTASNLRYSRSQPSAQFGKKSAYPAKLPLGIHPASDGSGSEGGVTSTRCEGVPNRKPAVDALGVLEVFCE